jgi:cytochrome P450
MRTVLGSGVFNSDGEMWQLHRSMSRPYFHRERVTHVDLFTQHSDVAISRMLERLSEPNAPAIDFQDLVSRFTLDSGTEFLFGSSTHSLDAHLPYPHESPVDESATFAAAFGCAQEQLMSRFQLGLFWPWFELFSDKTEESMKVINAFTNPILQAKLQQKREGRLNWKGTGTGNEEGETLLDHLVRFSDGT